MKLRLLMLEECNRSCPGCCNQYFDLDALEVCKSYEGYDEILLTGGEPMLYPGKIIKVAEEIRRVNLKAKIYLYTAYPNYHICNVIDYIDGLTCTFHEQDDVYKYSLFLAILDYCTQGKDFRLNVFKGIDLGNMELNQFKIKDNIEWDTDCPLPEGEVLMKLEG